MNKTIEPAFIVPKNKLISVGKFMGKLKGLGSELPLLAQQKGSPLSGKQCVRKDLKANWDEDF